MKSVLFRGAICAMCAQAAFAAEVWKSTFDSSADGVVDIYDNNPAKVTIGTASGGSLPLTVADSQAFPQTDRAGRPLGVTLDGHSEYSGLATFKLGSAIPAGGQTWNQIGFSGSPGSNPGVARYTTAAFMIWNHNGAGNVTLNLGLQWGGASGQDRNKIVGSIDLGTDAEVATKTFQLAIGYVGDINGLTNTFDTGTGTMTVSLYDGNGALLKTVTQGNITAGDGGGQTPLLTGLGGEPGIYPTFLSNATITHLGVLDYVATASARQVIYNMDSLAFYDTASDAFAAVVPEPASLTLLAVGGLLLGRRSRKS